MKNGMIISLTAAILASCSSTNDDTTKLNESVEVLETQVETMATSVSRIPDWFISPPSEKEALHAVGEGISSSIQLAMDKAVLNAKRSLADRVDSRISSKSDEFIVDRGLLGTQVSERTTMNILTEVDVSGYSVENLVIRPSGHAFQAFALLQYKLEPNRKFVFQSLRKESGLSVAMKQEKAFSELRSEIDRNRAIEREALEALDKIDPTVPKTPDPNNWSPQ